MAERAGKRRLCELTNAPTPFSECLACAHTRHPCQFPYEILSAMARNPEQRKDAGISITTCTGCARAGYYALATDFYQYPHLLWPALRGTAFHDFVERHPEPDCYYEHRFRRDLGGVVITGQVDKINPDEGLVVDLKSKEKLPDEVPEDYVWQTNGYRLLLEDGEVVSNNSDGRGRKLEIGERVHWSIERLGIVFVTMKEVRKYPVPLLPLDEVQEYFRERALAIHDALEGGPLPPRFTASPALNKLCTEWCPFYETCGG